MSQLSLFNAIPSNAIEILHDEQNQPWFKRADLGRFIGLTDIKASTSMIDSCEMLTRRQLQEG